MSTNKDNSRKKKETITMKNEVLDNVFKVTKEEENIEIEAVAETVETVETVAETVETVAETVETVEAVAETVETVEAVAETVETVAEMVTDAPALPEDNIFLEYRRIDNEHNYEVYFNGRKIYTKGDIGVAIDITSDYFVVGPIMYRYGGLEIKILS